MKRIDYCGTIDSHKQVFDEAQSFFGENVFSQQKVMNRFQSYMNLNIFKVLNNL